MQSIASSRLLEALKILQKLKEDFETLNNPFDRNFYCFPFWDVSAEFFLRSKIFSVWLISSDTLSCICERPVSQKIHVTALETCKFVS